MKNTHLPASLWGKLNKSLKIGKHLVPYESFFTRPTKESFRMIMEELLSMKSPNATEISIKLAKSISSVSYFFSEARWDHRKIESARKRVVANARSTRSTEDDLISLDATTISKTGKTFPDISRVFDTAEKKVTNGYYFYLASIVHPKYSHSSIADWLLIAPKAYQFRSLWRGWMRILRRIFTYSKAKMVVLDAGFRNQYLLRFIMQNRRHFLIRATGSMIVSVSGTPMKISLMKKRRARCLQYGDAILTIRIIHGVMKAWSREIPESLSIVMIQRTGFRKPLILATSKDIGSVQEAVLLYQFYLKRWSIEVLFKDLKMELGLEKFRVRSMVAILRYLTLIVFAHTILILKLGRLRYHPKLILLLQNLLVRLRKVRQLLVVSLKKLYEMMATFSLRSKIYLPLTYQFIPSKSW